MAKDLLKGKASPLKREAVTPVDILSPKESVSTKTDKHKSPKVRKSKSTKTDKRIRYTILVKKEIKKRIQEIAFKEELKDYEVVEKVVLKGLEHYRTV